GKATVGLLFAQVFKRKHSDRFFGPVARPDDVDLGFRRAVRCAHDSVSGKIEKPGEHQRDRKPEYDEEHDQADHRVRNIEYRKNLRNTFASAQPPTTYATATVKTLRLFSSSKNSLGSMAGLPQ